MTSSLSYNSNSQLNGIATKNISQENGIIESIAKLSRKENALLEEVNLQEWRKNLKLVRERSLS
jgi:hypothetical protein